MQKDAIGQLRQGFQAIKRLVGFVYFAAPDASGVNSNWAALDYDAPAPPPVDVPLPISLLKITQDTILEADSHQGK